MTSNGFEVWQTSVESEMEEFVYAHIRTHEAAISIIDEEIAGLMRTIRQLHFKKQEHAEGIRHCKSLITVARRLPHEILARIFEICVQDGYTRTPFVVSRVCSQWRRATSIPSVWSHIYVDLDDRDCCNRTRFWLTKARNSGLRITLEIRQEQTRLPEVADLLLEKRSQWRVLTINSVLLDNVNHFLTVCTGPFPQLCALYFSVQQEFGDNDDQTEWDETRELVGLRAAFLDAPNLHTTHIARNILPAPNIIPPLIKNLSLALPSYRFTFNLSITSVLEVLKELCSLQVLSITLPAGQARRFEPAQDAGDIVLLHHLVAITLTGWRDMYELLPHLVTPKLKYLHLRSPDDVGSAPDEEVGLCLLRFLRRASPPLEELELRDADIPAAYLIQCFARLDQLRTLRLHESEISDDVLAELNGPNGYCPSLTSLDFRWCGYFRGQSLVRLVKSRLPENFDTDDPISNSGLVGSACAPILKVTVINCAFVRAQDIVALASLTLCQVVVAESDESCRNAGCCINDRYRKRLALEGIGRTGGLIL